ncbi:hypothetical protein Barb7_02065 [Bacteroidales bacterium Barb7]|nr:hypothetical protein Barb7_02065 [Bacteroidales bacterium Barb7]
MLEVRRSFCRFIIVVQFGSIHHCQISVIQIVHPELGRNIDRQFIAACPFGCHHNHPVCPLRAVDRRRSGIFQDSHRLNIIRVQRKVGGCADNHAVNHPQRRSNPVDGRLPANDNAAPRTRLSVAWSHIHARSLARQHVFHRRIGSCHNLLILQRLQGTRQALPALYAVADHNDLFQRLRILLDAYRHRRRGSLHFQPQIADIGHRQHSPAWSLQRELPVEIGHLPRGRPLHQDVGTDNRLAGHLINHRTRNSHRLRANLHPFGTHGRRNIPGNQPHPRCQTCCNDQSANLLQLIHLLYI